MDNNQKYIAILENLDKNPSKNDLERLKSNLAIIRKYIKDDIEILMQRPALSSIKYILNDDTSEDLEWNYTSLLFHILLTISQNKNLNSDIKEELISLQQQDCITTYVIEASTYGICPNLLSNMQNHKIFQMQLENKAKTLNIAKLKICLSFLEHIFKINFLMAGSKIAQVRLNSMAAVFSILSSDEIVDEDLSKINKFLLYLWEHSCKVSYFRNLLILKSIRNLPELIQNKLHEDLVIKLESKLGFKILLEAIAPAKSNTSSITQHSSWQRFEVVANIISHKSHTEEFHDNLLNQIFEFLQISSGIEEQHSYIPGGVLSLRKLYFLSKELKEKILKRIDDIFKEYYNPTDVLTGAILFDDDQFLNFLQVLNFIFCGSSFQSLPSEILIEYMPILIQCYDQIPESFKHAKLIKSLIIQCLTNRKKEDLKLLLKTLILETFQDKYKSLHFRITFNINERNNSVNVQIMSPENNNRNDIFAILCRILKTANNNILLYNCFILVLYLFEEDNMENKNLENAASLLQNEEELNIFIEKRFKSKFAVISFLTDLIEFRPLHSQFKENPAEIIEFLRLSLNGYLYKTNSSEEKLSITISIFQEVVENSNSTEVFINFIPIIKKLLNQDLTLFLKQQLMNILRLLEGNVTSQREKNNTFDKSDYEIARKFIEENQPYLKVYGINLMTKLINNKDTETISNKHAILAMALITLKDEESYTFLNCIKLFVTLISTIEAEVLEVLSDEYLSDNNETDYRLKLGEAILKVTEDLGPISYKYKTILINCFLSGCRHPLDEFRLSSISNLATICKLLTYQVHNFFQELLQLIESILQTDKYLPAKRATVLVLTELLSGMDNLLDFQEYLLPIYRTLKYIAANDTDAVMQTHANNGLKILMEKCKKFLIPEPIYEKEIKIFGVKDIQKKKTGNILELN